MESICGQIGLSLNDFYAMTPRQFENWFDGWMIKEQRDFKNSWEQTRWISFWGGIAGLKKGTKPNQLLSFEWDQIDSISNMPSQEEIDASREFWKEYDKNKAQKKNGPTDH